MPYAPQLIPRKARESGAATQLISHERRHRSIEGRYGYIGQAPGLIYGTTGGNHIVNMGLGSFVGGGSGAQFVSFNPGFGAFTPSAVVVSAADFDGYFDVGIVFSGTTQVMVAIAGPGLGSFSSGITYHFTFFAGL